MADLYHVSLEKTNLSGAFWPRSISWRRFSHHICSLAWCAEVVRLKCRSPTCRPTCCHGWRHDWVIRRLQYGSPRLRLGLLGTFLPQFSSIRLGIIEWSLPCLIP